MTVDDLKDMSVDISWGDGTIGYGIPHHQATITAVSGDTVTVDDSDGFEPGEDVILYNGTDYETGTIAYIKGNDIILTSSPSNTYTSGYIVTDHRHIYNKSGSIYVDAIAHNDEDFASDDTSLSVTVATANPTAHIAVIPSEITTDDSFVISLADSILTDSGDSVSSYGIAIPEDTAASDVLYTDSSPSPIFNRKATNLLELSTTDQVQLTSDDGTESRTVWVYGSDGTSLVIDKWNGFAAPLTLTNFVSIYGVSVDTVSSTATITVKEATSGRVLGTIGPGYTDAFNNVSLTIAGKVSTSGGASDWDTTTLSFTPIYDIDLLTEIADSVENISMPHNRDYKLSESWYYKVLKLGIERTRVLKVTGVAVTQSGYTSCSISEGTVTFSGSGGNEYDDILLLDALISQGDHKVTINYNGQDYTGWLVDVSYEVTGGLSYRSWSATVVVV